MRNLLASMLLPPMGLLYLAAVALVLEHFARRTGRALMAICLTGLIILGLPVVSDSLLVNLERDLPVTPPADAMPGAIVVLGGDVILGGNPRVARPGDLTLQRLRAAASLHWATNLPVLVTGGTVKPDRAPVGIVMAESLQGDFHIPVKWVESKSLDTWENAAFSADILRKDGIKSIYVVTNGWHMRRALLAFSKTGLTVTAAPATTDARSGAVLTDYLPRFSAWQESYYSLHEWVGGYWYAAR